MEKKLRGIDEDFADNFKKSCLYKLYKDHEDELIIGVRNNYINIYYHCNSIAKVKYVYKNDIRCEIAGYFLSKNVKGRVTLKCEDEIRTNIVERYDDIKWRSDNQDKKINEHIAQQKLFISNNENPKSKWFCFDIEWRKSYEDKNKYDNSEFTGRFDILAISKDTHHKIAIIELKYDTVAIDGDSGIATHIHDFCSFSNHNYFEEFIEEAISIIRSLTLLNIDVPQSLQDLVIDQIDTTPYFYIETLSINDDIAKKIKDENSHSCGINLTFLFSKLTNDDLEKMNDIDIIEGFEEPISNITNKCK